MSAVSATSAESLCPGQFAGSARVHSVAVERGTSRRSGEPPRAAGLSTDDRYTMAVRRTLGWAQESADRGDYADALGWIGVLAAIGEQLPAAYETKRRAWAAALVGAEPKGG
jgi:hypothetical protein